MIPDQSSVIKLGSTSTYRGSTTGVCQTFLSKKNRVVFKKNYGFLKHSQTINRKGTLVSYLYSSKKLRKCVL